MRPRLAFLLLLLFLPTLLSACGSKTALVTGSAPADSGVDSAVDTSVADTAVVDTAPDSRPSCVSDDECDDGVFCNGVEVCTMGVCATGPVLDCIPPPDGCTDGFCDEATRACVFVPVDRDMDGQFPLGCPMGTDCNDEDPTVFEGAMELCDYQDNDCNSQVDEGLPYAGLGDARDVSAGVTGASRPDVGWSGSEYQVVYDSEDGHGQVFLTNVRRNGQPASDPTEVTFSMVLASSADLQWTGSEYGLWHHFHLDSLAQGTVSLTRIDASGSIVRRAVATTPDVPDADVPAAAWSGTDWGVAFVASPRRGAREVRFVRAARDGSATVMPFTLSGPLAIPFVKPSVAWTGRRFVAAWGEGSTVRLAALDPGGSRVDWQRRLPALDEPQVSLQWTGSELMVTFTSTTTVDQVHLVRYGDDGLPHGATVTLSASPAQQSGVDSVWTGSELAVTYQNGRSPAVGTWVVRVGEGARWISPPGMVDDRAATVLPGAAIAYSGREYGVAFPAASARGGAVFFRRVGCD